MNFGRIAEKNIKRQNQYFVKLDLAEREMGSSHQALYQLDILFLLQTIPLTVLPTILCFSLA